MESNNLGRGSRPSDAQYKTSLLFDITVVGSSIFLLGIVAYIFTILLRMFFNDYVIILGLICFKYLIS